MVRAELASVAGLAGSGGTCSTYLSRLRSNGLIVESSGLIRLAAELRDG